MRADDFKRSSALRPAGDYMIAVGGPLHKAGVPTKVVTPSNMGHETPLEKKTEMYRGALSWLDAG